jgi:hypothetical protein
MGFRWEKGIFATSMGPQEAFTVAKIIFRRHFQTAMMHIEETRR